MRACKRGGWSKQQPIGELADAYIYTLYLKSPPISVHHLTHSAQDIHPCMGYVWTAFRIRWPTGREAACSSRQTVSCVVVSGGGGGVGTCTISVTGILASCRCSDTDTGTGKEISRTLLTLLPASCKRKYPTAMPTASSSNIAKRRGILIFDDST